MTNTCADGEAVEALLHTLQGNDRHADMPEESHFICSPGAARRLVSVLMTTPAPEDGGTDPFFVFAAEKRRVRVTVVRRQAHGDGQRFVFGASHPA